MKLEVRRETVWATAIEDRAGGLAAKLAPLTAAGADLEFVIARRAPDQPGQGVVFVTPVHGTRQLRAAKAAGYLDTESLHSIRIVGPDRPGTALMLARALADARINVRGFSATALGKRFVAYFAFDDADDATRAVRTLRRLR